MNGSGHGEKLTRKKEQAIVALLTEPTITRAADSAGIAEATLRRWMRLDEFGRLACTRLYGYFATQLSPGPETRTGLVRGIPVSSAT